MKLRSFGIGLVGIWLVVGVVASMAILRMLWLPWIGSPLVERSEARAILLGLGQVTLAAWTVVIGLECFLLRLTSDAGELPAAAEPSYSEVDGEGSSIGALTEEVLMDIERAQASTPVKASLLARGSLKIFEDACRRVEGCGNTLPLELGLSYLRHSRQLEEVFGRGGAWEAASDKVLEDSRELGRRVAGLLEAEIARRREVLGDRAAQTVGAEAGVALSQVSACFWPDLLLGASFGVTRIDAVALPSGIVGGFVLITLASIILAAGFSGRNWLESLRIEAVSREVRSWRALPSEELRGEVVRIEEVGT